MKKQLIEVHQENEIVCDNPKCDYTVPNTTGNPYIDSIQYVNKPCPKCGENLLTIEDYTTYNKTMKIIKWVNKYFSWLCYILPTPKKTSTVKIHNGVTIHNPSDKVK